MAITGASLDPIYEQLNGVQGYHPLSAETFMDWSVEAGDTVNISRDGVAYSSPIHSAKIVWRGSPMVTINSTGSKEREAVARTSRKKYGRSGYGMRSDQQIHYDLYSEDGLLHTELAYTESRLEIDFTNQISSVRSEFLMTASELYAAFSDEVSGLASDFQITASEMEARFIDTTSQMYSDFQLTARELEIEFVNTASQMNSDFQVTASNMEARFAATASGLYSEFQATASEMEVSFMNQVSGLASDFQITASEMEARFMDVTSQMYSDFEVTASHLEATFVDTTSQLESDFQLTASQLRADFESADSSLRASITAQANRIGLVVEGTGANAHIKAAQIVAAINDDGTSETLISADKVTISGNTTINDVFTVSDGYVYTKVSLYAGIGTVFNGSHVGSFYYSQQEGGHSTQYGILKKAEVVDNTLKIWKFGDSDANPSITFSKATTLSGEWSGDSYTVTATTTATQNGETAATLEKTLNHRLSGTTQYQSFTAEVGEYNQQHTYFNRVQAISGRLESVTSGGHNYVDVVWTNESGTDSHVARILVDGSGSNVTLESEWANDVYNTRAVSGGVTVASTSYDPPLRLNGSGAYSNFSAEIYESVQGGTVARKSVYGYLIVDTTNKYVDVNTASNGTGTVVARQNMNSYLQDKTASGTGITVLPDSGYIGLSSVTVPAVTPVIDHTWSNEGTLTVTTTPAAQENLVRQLSQGTPSWSGTTVTIPINATYGSSGQYSESTNWSASVNVSGKLQSKTFNTVGTKTPDSGYIGFSSVTVQADYSKVKTRFSANSGTYFIEAYENSSGNPAIANSSLSYKLGVLAASPTIVRLLNAGGTAAVTGTTPTYTIPLETKTVTSGKTASTVTPSSGKVGISSITVNAVTVSSVQSTTGALASETTTKTSLTIRGTASNSATLNQGYTIQRATHSDTRYVELLEGSTSPIVVGRISVQADYTAGYTAEADSLAVTAPANNSGTLAGTDTRTTINIKATATTTHGSAENSRDFTLARSTYTNAGGDTGQRCVILKQGSTAIGRIDVMADYNAGKSSISLTGPTWTTEDGTTVTHNTATYSTSGKPTETTKSLALYLTNASWADGECVVYMRQASTSGTIRSQKTITAPTPTLTYSYTDLGNPSYDSNNPEKYNDKTISVTATHGTKTLKTQASSVLHMTQGSWSNGLKAVNVRYGTASSGNLLCRIWALIPDVSLGATTSTKPSGTSLKTVAVGTGNNHAYFTVSCGGKTFGYVDIKY